MHDYVEMRAKFDALCAESDDSLEAELGVKDVVTDQLMEDHNVTVLYYGAEGVPGFPWEAYLSGDSHYVDTNPGYNFPGRTARAAVIRAIVANNRGVQSP